MEEVALLDAERDTRVETLIPGDRLRWCGRVYGVTKVRVVSGNPALVGWPLPARPVPRVAVDTDSPNRWGGHITLLFPAGHFVAADLTARPPAEREGRDLAAGPGLRARDVAPSRRTTPRGRRRR